MAELRVKKEGGGGKPPGRGKITVPLWPFLLFMALFIPALLLWWPQPRQQDITYFNPVTSQNQVFTYENRRYVPVADATRHQVAVDPKQMVVVGHADGQQVYAPGPKGGGGGTPPAPPAGLYLRSGNDLFVPLRELKSAPSP